jgi:hypothetical protein
MLPDFFRNGFKMHCSDGIANKLNSYEPLLRSLVP